MLAQSVNHVTLDTSPSPTKSERDSAVLEGLVQARDGGEAIPPVVARIFSGDSTSPLTREARTWCEARDSAKQTERSFKGKGVGDFRGIVRFFEESMSVQL